MYYKKILPNGLTIIGEYLPHVHSVSTGIMIGAGVDVENSSNNGISHLIEHMLFKGTEQRDALQIAETMDQVGGRLNAYTAKEFTMFHTVVLDSHIFTAIDLLADLILNSKLDAEHLEREKKVVLEEIKMNQDSPDEFIHDIFVSNLWKNNSLGQMILGTEETIGKLKRADLIDFMDKYYAPNNITISIAGNFDFEKVSSEIYERFKHRKKSEIVRNNQSSEISPDIVLEKRNTEQVHICLGGEGFSFLDTDRFKLAVLNSVLGGSMSSRLFQEIREERGLAYNVYSYYSFYRSLGMFSIYAGTSLENSEEVVRLIKEELEKIAREGITETELKKAQEHIKGNVVLSLENTSSRMNWNAKNFFYLKDFMEVQEVFAHIDKLTVQDILELANRIFKKDKLLLTAIGPFEKKKYFKGVL